MKNQPNPSNPGQARPNQPGVAQAGPQPSAVQAAPNQPGVVQAHRALLDNLFAAQVNQPGQTVRLRTDQKDKCESDAPLAAGGVGIVTQRITAEKAKNDAKMARELEEKMAAEAAQLVAQQAEEAEQMRALEAIQAAFYAEEPAAFTPAVTFRIAAPVAKPVVNNEVKMRREQQAAAAEAAERARLQKYAADEERAEMERLQKQFENEDKAALDAETAALIARLELENANSASQPNRPR